MKPITRKEYYLAKAAGLYSGPTPAPVLWEDYYLATLAGDYTGYCPPPVTRIQKYMSVATGVYNTALPKPITREEMYWYNIATKTGFLPEPVTRYEKMLYAIAIKAPEPEYVDKTAQGNPLLLNSAAAPFTSLTLYGWSKQDGTPSPDNPVPIVSAGSVMTTGAQLANLPDVEEYVHNGITYSCNGGIITLNGTATNVESSTINSIFYRMPIIAGTYYVSGSTSDINVCCRIKKDGQTPEYTFSSFSLDGSETEAIVFLRIWEGKTFNNVKCYPMLNAGDIALPWEPYTGGQPAANPYEGEINVTVQGGNLFNVQAYPFTEGSYINFNTGMYALNSLYKSTKDFIPFSEYVGFTINLNHIPGGSNPGMAFYTTNTDDGYISGGKGNEIIVPEGTKYMRFTVDIDILDNDVMINAGSITLPYEPYKPHQTLTVSAPGGLPGIPVTPSKLPEGVEPTYTDADGHAWICDWVDFERGVYVRRVWKHTFDGSEVWSLYTSTSLEGFYLANILPETMQMREGFTNQFGIYSGNPKVSIRFGANNNIIYAVCNPFYDPSLPDSGLSNWKAHLAAHPLEIMAYLTTATEEPLTAAEIAAYKALRTYSPTTTVSNDAEAWMKVGYKAPAE